AGRASPGALPAARAEDPPRFELLRRRVRPGRRRPHGDRRVGARQPDEGGRGKRGPVPERAHGMARASGPGVRRATPDLMGAVMLVVVKYGGGGGVDQDALCAGVAALLASGVRVVLVHGGSADMRRIAEPLGVELRTLTAPDGVVTRYTDEATLDV